MASGSEAPQHRHRAWSVIVMGADQQYAGNRGYVDDPHRVYCYDSKVSNWRNVASGDLLFIRDSEALIGVACIERIDRRSGTKMMLRCPACGTTGIKTRKSLAPRYRCDRGHEFATPRRERASVTKLAAHYARTFKSAKHHLPAGLLKQAALRPSDQLSIEEIDPQRLGDALLRAAPACKPLLDASQAKRREAYKTLAAHEALEKEDQAQAPYTRSNADTRPSATRTIRWRRGQRRFRQALMRRYGTACMVTGCRLVDLLEAAHISAYRADEDHHVENGLLLRADIHTLFDLHLLAIDPDSLKIRLAREVKRIKSYAALEGVRLRTGARHRPARTPLEDRWQVFESTRTARR